MKRLISLLMAGIMMMSLCACGSGDKAAKEPETIGEAMQQDFLANAGEMDAQEMANTLLGNKMIEFATTSAPVEEGLMTGFGNAEIKGFEKAVMFGPMIGTIPFVGYVFEMADGADTDAFVQTLKDNANPRWNVCTEAEETVVEVAENMVLFVMCPKTMEE